MDLRVNAVAVIVIVACAITVASRVSSAPAPAAGAVATHAQRSRIAASIAADEAAWTRQVEQDFPHDLWSQRDAFHGREAQAVRDHAGGSRLPYEEVLRAIDDDIHKSRGGPDRHAAAIPCKPRPFYD
jgi:hypothetical protein